LEKLVEVLHGENVWGFNTSSVSNIDKVLNLEVFLV
jgi:hypothetical protein